MVKVKKFTFWQTFNVLANVCKVQMEILVRVLKFYDKLGSMTNNADQSNKWASYAGPGGWNG